MCCSIPSLAAIALVSHSAKGIRTMRSMVQVNPQPTFPSRNWDTEEKKQAGIDDANYSVLGKEVPLHHRWGKRSRAKSNYLGQLPVPVTPGHCEAAKCSQGSITCYPITPVNSYHQQLVQIKRASKANKENDKGSLDLLSGMFLEHSVGQQSMHQVQCRTDCIDDKLCWYKTNYFFNYYLVNSSTATT